MRRSTVPEPSSARAVAYARPETSIDQYPPTTGWLNTEAGSNHGYVVVSEGCVTSESPGPTATGTRSRNPTGEPITPAGVITLRGPNGEHVDEPGIGAPGATCTA